MPKKLRADILLVEQGLAPTRSKAQSLILSGSVYAGTQRIDKASETFSPETQLQLKGKDHDYVSRGGLKLKAALDHFKLNVRDQIFLDIGASTGGFTDCLLQHGAKKIHAFDVGYGQLDWKLQQDDRVVVWDRTNFRHFEINQIQDFIDGIVMDVSFISITKLLPKLKEALMFSDLNSDSDSDSNSSPQSKLCIFLVKPQFELSPDKIGKKGVVRELAYREEALNLVKQALVENGFRIEGWIDSPIKGKEGNQEYLMVAWLKEK